MLLSFLTVSTSQSCPTAWLLASFKGNHPAEGGEAFKTEARTDIHDLCLFGLFKMSRPVSIQGQETTQNSGELEAEPIGDTLETFHA